jgi:hypothetical protein
MNYITMNQKEREQAKLFAQVEERIITQAEAAARLRLSERWVRKKIKRYRELNDFGLVHKSRGKTSPKRWDPEQERLLVDLLKGEWHGFGPTFAAEKLEELHGIKVSREVVRKVMIRENLWQPKQRGKHRKRRERKPMLGMMVQLDGSPHDWFEGRAAPCTLLVFIDDATSKILWLEFAKSESVESLMQATKNYVQKHGIPQSFYTDHGSVFHVNLNNQENIKKTQWERACDDLNIKVNHAHSPQAKGRVERCHQTMQDRLDKEMRLAKISSIEEANEYLRTSNFIEKHNAKYAVLATQKGNAHADAKSYDLDDIFSIKETRILANDFTITFNKRIFQLHGQQKTILRPKNEIVVKTHLDGTIRLWVRKTEIIFTEINARTGRKVQKEKIANHLQCRPSENSKRWASGKLPLSRVKPAAPAVEAL